MEQGRRRAGRLYGTTLSGARSGEESPLRGPSHGEDREKIQVLGADSSSGESLTFLAPPRALRDESRSTVGTPPCERARLPVRKEQPQLSPSLDCPLRVDSHLCATLGHSRRQHRTLRESESFSGAPSGSSRARVCRGRYAPLLKPAQTATSCASRRMSGSLAPSIMRSMRKSDERAAFSSPRARCTSVRSAQSRGF